jgi:hypothetical protein
MMMLGVLLFASQWTYADWEEPIKAPSPPIVVEIRKEFIPPVVVELSDPSPDPDEFRPKAEPGPPLNGCPRNGCRCREFCDCPKCRCPDVVSTSGRVKLASDTSAPPPPLIRDLPTPRMPAKTLPSAQAPAKVLPTTQSVAELETITPPVRWELRDNSGHLWWATNRDSLFRYVAQRNQELASVETQYIAVSPPSYMVSTPVVTNFTSAPLMPMMSSPMMSIPPRRGFFAGASLGFGRGGCASGHCGP